MTTEEILQAVSQKEEFSGGLRSEYRYILVIQVQHEGKVYSSANKIPIPDIKQAKELAIKNVNIQIHKGDNIIIRGYKYLYADVPKNNIITGTSYEMECISCESLTEEELKSI